MPLSCHLYDQLEIAAMKGLIIRIEFTLPQNGKTVYEGRIKDLQCHQGREYLVTPSDEKWWLEDVISIQTTNPPY